MKKRAITIRSLPALSISFICIGAVVYSSCDKKGATVHLSPADSAKIVEENLYHRAEMDDFFRNDPNSPFQKDTSITYHGVNWFPIDPIYRGHSVLHRHTNPDTVTVLGTKGEERRQLKYGYFEFSVPNENGELRSVRMNVYKFTPYDLKRFSLYKDHLSLWFTDKTTGQETYEVGRYIELGIENSDPSHVYDIDLNMAFNPYCAYSDLFSCAIPRKEDHIDIAIRVGEMKYHE